ncbi:MAG TPA: hypothetical protein VM901_07395 [Bdellovibrionota bacterium]|jgi:hypothetical protein|nr:hypothetical protein [Bdellovibrionota bacterium]
MEKLLVIFSFMGFASLAAAAEWQCFKFAKLNIPVVQPYDVPAIEIFRVDEGDGQTYVHRQEVIALNEVVDDVLAKKEVGDELCLKGRKGHTNLNKFFAYLAK